MLHYFGYGSNMNATSLRHKGVVPKETVRGTLPDWQLVFNVTHWFRHEGGVGNIVPRSGAVVEGLVHTFDDEMLAKLDRVESYGVGYDRIPVEIQTAAGPVQALTYVGLPGYLDDRCLPTQRYKNILLAGAADCGLPDDYVTWLREHPMYEHPQVGRFQPPAGDWPAYDAATLPADHTALAGHVFDMSSCREKHRMLIDLLGGGDRTLFHLRRLDTSDGTETLADVAHGRLDDHQRRYIDAYLAEYAHEYAYAGTFRYEEHRSP
jgi:sulfite reductase (NADPH) flavoprotein alpha-component